MEQEITNWDGKSAHDINAIYSRYCQKQEFLPTLIRLSTRKDSQKAATWLLKHHLDQGHTLKPEQAKLLCKAVSGFDGWETKLQFLQCLPNLPIDAGNKPAIEMFLRGCLMHENKFVRAWAYNGFYELSLQYPEHQEEAKQFLALAMRDEAPSVKARIRNILKKGF